MPTYEYQAQSSDGRIVSGVVFGASQDQALKDLTQKGLQVSHIGVAVRVGDPLAPPGSMPQARPVEQTAREGHSENEPAVGGPPTEQRSYVASSVVGPLVGQVPLPVLQFFFRQLATMLEAGVPYVQSLETLAGQARTPKFREVVYELKGHVEAGRPISVGMQRYPEVFAPVVISLVRAGEEAGFLDQALAQVADYIEREVHLRNLYKRVTFYPKLELGASIVIIIAANYILDSIHGKFRLWSPLTTPATWVVLTPIIITLFLFSRVGLANSRIKYNFDAFTANIPYLGGILRQLAMAKFGRAVGALHRGGVPVTRTVQLASDACGNEWLRSKMSPATQELESGAGITETLQATGAFSPIVMNMVATGETTGNLDKMVDKMADFYEDEAETKSIQLAKIVGLFVSLLVFIYLGIVIVNAWTGLTPGLTKD